jgi:hypothetical protein
MRLEISGKTYKIEYNFNTLVDTDLLENVGRIQQLLSAKQTNYMAMVKDLVSVVRDMVQIGLEENNPIADKKEVGRLIEAYLKEGTEDEPRTILGLFGILNEEMENLGFLSMIDAPEKKEQKMPQDHKKPSK